MQNALISLDHNIIIANLYYTHSNNLITSGKWIKSALELLLMLCSSIIFVKISHFDYEYDQNILYKNLGNPLLLPSYWELGLVYLLKCYKSKLIQSWCWVTCSCQCCKFHALNVQFWAWGTCVKMAHID